MNTGDLIKQLSQKLSITQKEAQRLLSQELDAISQQLAKGNEVVIRGFGTLLLREAKPLADNTPRKNVILRASQKFKERVQSWRPHE
jgi:nucleoid DNA-binding protein